MGQMKTLFEDMRARVAAFEAAKKNEAAEKRDLENTIAEDTAAIAKALQDNDPDAYAKMEAKKEFHEEQMEFLKRRALLEFMNNEDRKAANEAARSAAKADALPHLQRLYQLRQEILQEYHALQEIESYNDRFCRLVDSTKTDPRNCFYLSRWGIPAEIAFVCTCESPQSRHLHRGDRLLEAYAPAKESK